jgi:hypothetical protein
VLRAVQALVGQAREAGGGMAGRLVLITLSVPSAIVDARESFSICWDNLLAGGRRRPSNIA